MKSKKTIFWLFITLILLSLIWIFYRTFLASKFTVTKNYRNNSKIISDLYPTGRVSSPEENLISGERYQRIMSDLVYFNIKPPKAFDSLKITLKYINPSQKFVELGMLKKPNLEKKNSEQEEFTIEGGGFITKPLENRYIDFSNWPRKEENGFLLLQKNNNYANVPDFIKNPPIQDGIALFNYELDYKYKINNYIPSNNFRPLNISLYGSHEFLTYAENENINLAFDLEKYNGEVSNFGLEILDQDDNVKLAKTWSEKLVVNQNLGNGLFKIKIFGDNFKINNIYTGQKYFEANKAVHLASKADLYTYSRFINFSPDNRDDYQNITINGENFSLFNQQTRWPESRNNNIYDIQEIAATKGNLNIDGSSVFAFSKDALFNPDNNVRNMKAGFDEEKDNYILAKDYISPKKAGRYTIASANFDLGQTDNRKYISFMLSSVGLDNIKDNIYLYEIKAEFNRRPYTFDRILKFIKNKL